jgi:hypothetical protein
MAPLIIENRPSVRLEEIRILFCMLMVVSVPFD